jgi:tRNA (guanine-N7-)-methyltransferase
MSPESSCLSTEAGALAEEAPWLGPDCWRRLFGNANPVAIEVGPGRGEFLRAVAVARPEWNFFGIEHSSTRTRHIEQQLATRRLANARVVWADAGWLLPHLPAASAAAVYVQFPDPWWKRRHHKRRLWTPAFVASIRTLLGPGATVEFLTDVADTFQLGLTLLDADPGLERVAVGALDRHDTNFARKALQGGGQIHRSVHRRP